MVRQLWQSVQDGVAAVVESSRWQDSSGRRLEMARQQWQRITNDEAVAAKKLRRLGQQWLHMHTTAVQQVSCARQHDNKHPPLEGPLLHVLREFILPLLQQVGGHDNEGGLDGHRLPPFVMVVLIQIHHWPGSWSWVGQNQHQTL